MMMSAPRSCDEQIGLLDHLVEAGDLEPVHRG